MAHKFTPEQQKAIETLDKSVLVSAAAGSGKTSVLVERIISIILEGKADVDEMLVVTFTNAAASEMRLRLASSIRKRMKEHPEEVPRLREQLSRMYRAYISTIDSFAQRVIREFFYEIDMEPEFGVCDEVQAELMKREAASELFEEAFDRDDIIEGGSFKEFLRLYSDERSDERFIENMIKSYDNLRTMPDYFDWAFDKAENLKLSPETFEGSALQATMLEDAEEVLNNSCTAIRKMRDLFETAGLEDMYESKLKEYCDAVFDLHSLVSAGQMNEDVMRGMSNLPKTNVRATKDQKESYESIKDEAKAIRDSIKKDLEGWQKRYTVPDFETSLAELNATYEYTVYFLRLLQAFEERYSAKKAARRLLDFADINHNAVKILQNDEAAEVLRRRFKFVFVDEYQDTNNIQEYLIGKVSSPCNVFKVGDVKQSIYKFRLAQPELFERLYRKYDDPNYEDGITIDLGRNFRTNDATIKYINRVFSQVMEGYDEKAELHTGVTCREGYDFKPEVHVLLKEDADIDGADFASDEETEELSSYEAESAYIAQLAADIIGTEFYDAKRNEIRKATAKDIAILYRSVKITGEQIAQALRKRKVEAHVEETDDYFDTLEVNIALSLFSCIDNLKRDVPLIATLHSEIFAFDPSELALIRSAHNQSAEKASGKGRCAYWEAFTWYVNNGPEGALREKAERTHAQIVEWRRLSRCMPLDDYIWKVLVDSGYYAAVGAMTQGAMRQANLRALADRAGAFSKDNVASLSSFIGFVEVMKSKKISNGQTPMVGKDDDVVRISTMHKSKGLEFPFVIVGGLGRKFQRDKNEKKFTFDSEIGVGMPYVDPKRKYWRSSVMQLAVNAKSARDSYREDLRLLYVDMTRARNKLYLVGTCDSEEALMKYDRPTTYLKVLRDFIKTEYNEYHIRPLPRVDSADSNKEALIDNIDAKALNAEEQAIYEDIDRRFSYVYPDEELLNAKSKYSVSAVRKEALESERVEEETIGDASKIENISAAVKRRKKSNAADIGTAYHRLMEFMDFAEAADASGKTNIEYIRERAEFLREHDAIDSEVFDALDISKIANFFSSDLGRRALAANAEGRLKREKPFTLKTKRDGREILVQGVIDCCFEEDGAMVLIDYKSSYVRKDVSHESELKRIADEYKVQIELYSEALEKGRGLAVGEAYLYLFDTGEAVRVQI